MIGTFLTPQGNRFPNGCYCEKDRFARDGPQSSIRNRISRQVGHIMNIFPTCLAAAGVETSELSLQVKVQELEGQNLLPHLRDTSGHDNRELYWEHKGNRAVREGDWKLVATVKKDWEFYNLAEDPTELNDLSQRYPDKVQALEQKYNVWLSGLVCCPGR